MKCIKRQRRVSRSNNMKKVLTIAMLLIGGCVAVPVQQPMAVQQVAPQPVYAAPAPAYPVYAAPYYAAPVSVGIGLGFGGGGGRFR